MGTGNGMALSRLALEVNIPKTNATEGVCELVQHADNLELDNCAGAWLSDLYVYGRRHLVVFVIKPFEPKGHVAVIKVGPPGHYRGLHYRKAGVVPQGLPHLSIRLSVTVGDQLQLVVRGLQKIVVGPPQGVKFPPLLFRPQLTGLDAYGGVAADGLEVLDGQPRLLLNRLVYIFDRCV